MQKRFIAVPDVFTARQACAYLGVSTFPFYQSKRQGNGPEPDFFMPGSGRGYYTRALLDEVKPNFIKHQRKKTATA